MTEGVGEAFYDNAPSISPVSARFVSNALDTLCSRLSFKDVGITKEIVSHSRAKHAYYSCNRFELTNSGFLSYNASHTVLIQEVHTLCVAGGIHMCPCVTDPWDP